MTGNDHLAAARAAILKEAIKEAPFSGWSVDMLRRAADAAGLPRSLQRLAFPRGVVDLVTAYSEDADRRMEAAATAEDLSTLKIRDRITRLVRLRLECVASEKLAVKRALDFLALPLHTPTAARLTFRTVDLMWRLAGDSATDFNYYSKRAILAAVYGTTLLAFLGDESEDHVETWGFLDRRIGEVMQFEKVKAQAKSVVGRWPAPAELLSRLRYPDFPRGR